MTRSFQFYNNIIAVHITTISIPLCQCWIFTFLLTSQHRSIIKKWQAVLRMEESIKELAPVKIPLMITTSGSPMLHAKPTK